MKLPRLNLVIFTWGNVSEFDPESGLFVIKPSGVNYNELSPEKMVVCDLDGKRVDGTLNPSSDTDTHAWIYRSWAKKGIHGVAHTHSSAATAWAQAGRDIPPYGTTHADYFYGVVPCMRGLTEAEVKDSYELNTGKVLVSGFAEREIDPAAIPAALVRNHGPFTWGNDCMEAVYHAAVVEECAKIARDTELLAPNCNEAPKYLQDEHYMRKHGANATYGQH